MPIRACLNPIGRTLLSWAILLAGAWLIGGYCVSSSLAAPPSKPVSPVSNTKTPAIKALESAGLKSDDASLLAYLAAKGDASNQDEIADLVRQLGADEWKTRDEATRKLTDMGLAAREALEKAANDPDTEIRARAKEILGHLTGPSQLKLVLNAIADRKTPGATPILLERIPTLGATDQETARRVLVTCARPEDAAVLRQALKDSNLDAELRVTVLTAFFQVSPQADVELLKACLTDKSMAVRKAGLYAMYKLPTLDESFVPVLVDMLAQEDIDVAGRAAGFLGRIGDPSSADALMAVLHKSNNFSFRYDVTDALVKMKGNAMAGPLIELLTEPGYDSRSPALMALGRIHAPQAAEAVIGVLDDTNNSVRSRACLLLASYGNPKAVEPLCRIVTNDNDPGVRRVAAYALGRIGDPRAVDSLIELLTTDDYQQDPAAVNSPIAPRPVAGREKLTPEEDAAIYKMEARQQAMTSLSVIGGQKAIDALFQATQSPQPEIRGKAISLLAEMGDKRAVDLAVKGLADSNYFVAYGAVNACDSLDDPRLIEPLIQLATSKRNARITMVAHTLGGGSTSGGWHMESYLREHALRLLKDRWPSEARPVLLGRLKDSEGFIAGRAAEWLADANDKSAVPDMIHLLENAGDVYAKAAAGRALCKMKVKAAFDPCLAVLPRYNDNALAAAMGELAQEGFLDELEGDLGTNRKGFRYPALLVLANVHKPELADAVLPLLDDKDANVRNAAITALGGLKNPKSAAVLIKRLKDELDEPGGIPAESSRPASAPAQPGHKRDDQVRLLAGALGNIGDPSAVEPLLAAMNAFQNDQFTSTTIAKALGQIGDKRAFEPLVKFVRMYPQAAECLALLGDKRALPHLQAAADASAADLAVAKAIFKLDPAASVDALDKVSRNFLNDYAEPRVKVVEMLGQVGGDQAIESLRFALRDDGFTVRQAARKALASLNTPATAPTSAPASQP